MSKLIKRIRKEQKNLENCLVIGDVWGDLASVVESFRNVFVKKTDKPVIKSRNVIVRNAFSEIAVLPQIDYVFVDGDCLDQLENIEKVMTHNSPLIYIGSGEFLDKDRSKYLGSLDYEIVEIRKDYQTWKRKR
jgi:hypothetical protein